MSILVTGGAGFIGSHTVLSLLNEQYDVVVIDNLCNSSPEAIKRVEKLAGRNLTFYHGDIRDSIFLEKIFNSNNIEAVIHCAALKSVGESNLLPLKYYSNNVAGALNLLQCMENNNVNKLIFSSSATVYGDTGKVPNSEADSIRRTTNPSIERAPTSTVGMLFMMEDRKAVRNPVPSVAAQSPLSASTFSTPERYSVSPALRRP